MGIKMGKWAVCLVALALASGGYYAIVQRSAQEAGSLPVASAELLASGADSPALTSAPLDMADGSVSSDAERERREGIMAKAIRAFDLEMVAYFKRVAAAHQEGKVAWRGIIANVPSLSQVERRQNLILWEKYLGMCQKARDLGVTSPHRMRFYQMFFNIESFAPTPEQLAILPGHDEWDEVPFGYITEVVNPAWYFEYEPIHYEYDGNSDKARSDLPSHLRELMATEEYREECPRLNLKPTQGVWHLDCYGQENAEVSAGETLRAIAKHTDLQGKDWAELGAGSGQQLPFFRKAIGPQAKLWAGDLDVFTRDVLEYCSRGTNTVVFRNFPTDCNCGENSFDIIDMSGVHMGPLNSPEPRSVIETQFLPWIRSMHKALRPGGLLVAQDGNWDLLERRVDSIIEEAGFKKIDEVRSQERDVFVWIFQVQK